MYQPTDVLTSEAQLREILPEQYPSQTGKVIDHVDDLIRVWIEHSPFLTMATVSATGRVDVSPKGDPGGFTVVLDDETIAIPERLGNRRADGFHNILLNHSSQSNPYFQYSHIFFQENMKWEKSF